ncbi:MAG: DsbA family protein [Anaerolineae bacterium]|nr:DsbA family protein [Anaerolineae bacterium]
MNGVSHDGGETSFAYPNPAGLPDNRQWLPALGEEDAPVVVMEFSDIFCSHCRSFNLDNLPGILEDYVATGEVRYVAHFFGFASSLEQGAVQAEVCAAEQGRYFEFVHALYQSIELGDYNIDRSARLAGLDTQQFDQCREERRYAEALQEMLFVDNNGVAATPTFFVNGQEVAGNNPDRLRMLIEAELAAQ